MISHYLPNHEIFLAPVRKLALRQMPSGEISDLPGKKWMLQGTYYTEVYNGIRKLNVTETQLAAELILQINDGKVNNFVSRCVMWLEEHRDSHGLFPIWVPSFFEFI